MPIGATEPEEAEGPASVADTDRQCGGDMVGSATDVSCRRLAGTTIQVKLPVHALDRLHLLRRRAHTRLVLSLVLDEFSRTKCTSSELSVIWK